MANPPRRHLGGKIPPQHNVPSQAPISNPVPYYPDPQVDIVRQQRYKPGGGVTSVPGTIPVNWYTVSTYDVRPINAIDFLKSFDETTDINSGTDTAQFFFTVPPGRVAVFRHFEAVAFYEVETLVTANHVTRAGSPLFPSTLQVFINGAGQTGITDKRIDNVYTTGVDFDLYFIADENEIVEFRILSGTPALLLDPWESVWLYVTGNLLLSDGLPADFMPANHAPVPVSIALGG